jgi:hypothetical protein
MFQPLYWVISRRTIVIVSVLELHVISICIHIVLMWVSKINKCWYNYYYYWWGGTKSLGIAATSGLLYKPQMIDEDSVYFVFSQILLCRLPSIYNIRISYIWHTTGCILLRSELMPCCSADGFLEWCVVRCDLSKCYYSSKYGC